MMRGRRSVSNTIYLLAGLLFAMIVGLMYGGLQTSNDKKPAPARELSMPQGSDMVLNKIHHEAVRYGVREWGLDARMAQFDDDGQTVLIEDIKLTIFGSDQSQTHVEAIKGKINMLSNDFTLRKNVKVKSQEYTLETQRISYTNDEKSITSDTRVHIKGPSMTVGADSAQFNLNTKKAVLEGNVTVTFGGA